MLDSEADLATRNRIVGEIVSHLALAEYEHVKAMAPRSRITPEQMRNAVTQYGRCLVPLPVSAYETIDYVAVLGSAPPAWSVVVPLFTQEEGRSDLSLELQLVRAATGIYEVEIDDLHVL
jgi:hypothetical protein